MGWLPARQPDARLVVPLPGSPAVHREAEGQQMQLLSHYFLPPNSVRAGHGDRRHSISVPWVPPPPLTAPGDLG